MRRYHVIGICLLAGFIMGCAVPAHAINHKYREQLIRSGCTEMNAGQGCDITKTKAQNAAALKQRPTTALDKTASEAESVIGTDIAEGADFLLQQGWRPNNGEWHKGTHILRLVVENEKVVNAQLVK